MSRLLVLELSDEGEVSVSESSDDWADWEIAGLALYLMTTAEKAIQSDLDDDG